MSEALLEKFIFNDKDYDVSEFEKYYIEKKPSIYEVIRIVDGVPVFLEEHYERLLNSADILGYKLDISIQRVKSNIEKMIKLNNVKNYNIKIVANSIESNSPNEYYFFIKSQYPDKELYEKGIKTFLYKAERENPNAKVINQNLRDEVNRLLKEKDCYEAMLVNSSDEITEGSRSNMFFIKQGKVFTAPAKDVLLGITRQRIISLCRKNGIEVVEIPILVKGLDTFEAAFMSGTSPKVLPISFIDELKLSPKNELLLKIIKIYDDEIQNYVKNFMK